MANYGPTMAKCTGLEYLKAWIGTYLENLDAARISTSSQHAYFCRYLHGSASQWYSKEVKYEDKLCWEKLCATFNKKWTPFPTTSEPVSIFHTSTSTPLLATTKSNAVKTVWKLKFRSAEEMRKMRKDIGIKGMGLGFNLCVAPSPRNQVVPDFGWCGKELRERMEGSAERLSDYLFNSITNWRVGL